MTALLLLFASLQASQAQPSPGRSQARVRTPMKRAASTTVTRRKASFPVVDLHAVNVDETLRFRPFDEDGRLRKGADRELSRLLRCWHTGRERQVNSRLGRVLYAMARHFAGHRVEIYSGFRPRAFSTRERSRHLTASAVDFRVDGVGNEAVVAWLRQSLHRVGVGYYPNGVHVHLDVDRDRDTYWVDAGDAPNPESQPVAAVGDTSPGGIEATADEPLGVTAPDEPARFTPPSEDPGFPQ